MSDAEAEFNDRFFISWLAEACNQAERSTAAALRWEFTATWLADQHVQAALERLNG